MIFTSDNSREDYQRERTYRFANIANLPSVYDGGCFGAVFQSRNCVNVFQKVVFTILRNQKVYLLEHIQWYFNWGKVGFETMVLSLSSRALIPPCARIFISLLQYCRSQRVRSKYYACILPGVLKVELYTFRRYRKVDVISVIAETSETASETDKNTGRSREKPESSLCH